MKIPATIKLLLCASLTVLLQLSAYAHTGLKESTPAAAATVKMSPEHLLLVFTEPVKLLKLELMGVGHEMPTGFEANSEAMVSYRIETPGMHPGEFTVNWAVIGADGHAVSNSFSFTVDPNATDVVADHGHGAAEGHGHDAGAQAHGHDAAADHH